MTGRDRTLAVVVGVVVVLGGVAITAVRYVGEDPLARNAESLLAALALGSIVAAPGVLALIAASTGRPALLLPAAIVLVPLSFISFALVTLPLLVPAFLLVATWARSIPDDAAGRTLLAGFVAVACLVTAGWAVFALTVNREFTDGSSTFGTTGWTPWSTSALAFALVVVGILGSTALAPRAGR